MTRFTRATLFSWFLVLACGGSAAAQSTTYHLHKEASSTSGLFQLHSSNPEGTSLVIQSIDLKNQAAGEYIVKAFDTASGVPGTAGTIPANATLSFTMWMKKTANFGTMYPRVRVRLNNAAGALLCEKTGTASNPNQALTTTLQSLVLSCTTSTEIVMSATDRFYLWVGINMT